MSAECVNGTVLSVHYSASHQPVYCFIAAAASESAVTRSSHGCRALRQPCTAESRDPPRPSGSSPPDLDTVKLLLLGLTRLGAKLLPWRPTKLDDELPTMGVRAAAGRAALCDGRHLLVAMALQDTALLEPPMFCVACCHLQRWSILPPLIAACLRLAA